MKHLLGQQLKFWLKTLGSVLLFAVLIIAILLQLGRTLSPALEDFKQEAEQQLSQRLGIDIHIGGIQAKWRGLRPELRLTNIYAEHQLSRILYLKRASTQIDLWQTLLHWQPRLRKIIVSDLDVQLAQSYDGHWTLKGLANTEPPPVEVDPPAPMNVPAPTPSPSPVLPAAPKSNPLSLLGYGRRLELNQVNLHLTFRNGVEASVTAPLIRLENQVQFHRLTAELTTGPHQKIMRLLLEAQGDPENFTAMTSQGYLQLQDFPTDDILTKFNALPPLLESLKHAGHKLNVNVWFNGNIDQGLFWQGQLNWATPQNTALNKSVWPNQLNSQWQGQWHPHQGWQTQFNHTAMTWLDKTSPPLTAQLLGKVGQPTELRIAELDLNAWTPILKSLPDLPSEWSNLIQQLNPQGRLAPIRLRKLTPEQGHFELQAYTHQLSVDPWRGAPRLKGITGFLNCNARQGEVVLNTRDGFEMAFPNIYSSPLIFDEAEGRVRWDIYSDPAWVGVSSNTLRLKNNAMDARGHFNLRLPINTAADIEPEMTLMIGAQSGAATLHKQLVPFTVPKPLYDWLDRSHLQGQLSQIGFIYHGSLQKQNTQKRTVQLMANVKNGLLNYDPAWPLLDIHQAHFYLDDTQVHVSELEGTLSKLKLTQGDVEFLPLNEQRLGLKINGVLSGESADAAQFIQQSPLAKTGLNDLAHWEWQGPLTAKTFLQIPLSGATKKRDQDPLALQNIQLSWQDAHLKLPDLNLNFEQLNGQIAYDSMAGLSAQGVTANLWNQPIKLDLTTRDLATGREFLGDFTSHVDIQDLAGWSQRPELIFAQGQTKIKGQLIVPLNNDPRKLDIHSQLKGITLTAPPPMQKNAHEIRHFSFQFMQWPTSHQKNYHLNLDSDIQLNVIQNAQGQTGSELTLNQTPSTPQWGQFNIKGHLESGHALDWKKAIQTYLQASTVIPASTTQKPTYATQKLTSAAQKPIESAPVPLFNPSESLNLVTAKANSTPLMSPLLNPPPADSLVSTRFNIQLLFDQLWVYDAAFEKTTISATNASTSWIFNIDQKNVAGVIEWPSNTAQLNVKLSRLHVGQNPKESEVIEHSSNDALKPNPIPQNDLNVGPTAPAQDIWSRLNPADIVAMDIQIDDLKLNQRALGRWTTDLRPLPNGLVAQNIKADTLGLIISGSSSQKGGELIWLKSPFGHITYTSAHIQAKNMADTFQALGLTPMFTSQKGEFDLDLHWNAPPLTPKLALLNGQVKVNMQSGNFYRGQSSAQNPLLKLVGLLNFDTLARRLRLDFSDLGSSGLAYELAEGQLIFDEGIIHIPTPLQVTLPSSHLQLVGQFDIPTETMDAKLVATLPVTGNLTLAAALTGAIPLAAGVYVTGKLFKKQVDKASSLTYQLKGPWVKPNSQLIGVFDNQLPTHTTPLEEPQHVEPKH